ncbi:MAG TPA: class I SAM-dependent methyltransferase [Streptosporangiaceae bacterium]
MAAYLSQAAASAWIDRWDAQQQGFLPDREERFTAMIDAVQESAGRPDPLVLDLGCGPGSLATRLLARIPAATVVAVDADPLLLALGRSAQNASSDGAGDAPGSDAAGSLKFVDLDLREPGWTGALGLGRQADAVLSTTALHWLPPDALAAMYAEVATVLRPGGLVLNGDHLAEDKAAAPTLARLGRALNEIEQRRRRESCGRRGGSSGVAQSDQEPDTWDGWWDAVTGDPALADLVAERRRRSQDCEHHGSPSGRLSVHVDALRAAGFVEIGTIWQYGEDRVLCGVLGA